MHEGGHVVPPNNVGNHEESEGNNAPNVDAHAPGGLSTIPLHNSVQSDLMPGILFGGNSLQQNASVITSNSNSTTSNSQDMPEQQQISSTDAQVVVAAARAAMAKMIPSTPMLTSVMQVMASQVKQEVDRPNSPVDEGIPMGNLLPSQKKKPGMSFLNI